MLARAFNVFGFVVNAALGKSLSIHFAMERKPKRFFLLKLSLASFLRCLTCLEFHANEFAKQIGKTRKTTSLSVVARMNSNGKQQTTQHDRKWPQLCSVPKQMQIIVISSISHREATGGGDEKCNANAIECELFCCAGKLYTTKKLWFSLRIFQFREFDCFLDKWFPSKGLPPSFAVSTKSNLS